MRYDRLLMSTTRIARPVPELTPEQRAKIFKALSDPRRIDIVDSLAKHGSQCGTQLAEELDVSIALLCHHWEVLVDCGLVKKERVGQLRMCTLDSELLARATGAWAAQRPPRGPGKKAQRVATSEARPASKAALPRAARAQEPRKAEPSARQRPRKK